MTIAVDLGHKATKQTKTTIVVKEFKLLLQTKHSAQDEGLFYTMPQRMFDDFVKTGIHPSYSRLVRF